MVDETTEFERSLKKFSKYKSLGKVMQDYFEKLAELPPAPITEKEKIDWNQALLCVVPYNDHEDYMESFNFYNHYFYVNIGENKVINNEFVQMRNPHIIWIAKSNSRYYVIGWSSHNQIFSQQQSIRHTNFGGYDIDYQIKTKFEGLHVLSLPNCNCKILKSKLPKDFERFGLCQLSEAADVTIKEVMNYINQYNCDFYPIGFSDDIIDACAPLIEKDTEKIIGLSLAAEDNVVRSLCLANLAAKQDPCFDTISNAISRGRFFCADIA